MRALQARGTLVVGLSRRQSAADEHEECDVTDRAAVDAVEMTLDAAGNRKPSRENRAKKIDALVATLLGLDRYLRRDPTPAARPA